MMFQSDDRITPLYSPHAYIDFSRQIYPRFFVPLHMNG